MISYGQVSAVRNLLEVMVEEPALFFPTPQGLALHPPSCLPLLLEGARRRAWLD